MSVLYSSLDARLIQWATARVCACPTVWALLGVADAPAAIAKAIELDTDLPGPGALIVVGAPKITSSRKTMDGYFEGTATIRVVIEWPPTNGDTIPETHRRAANIIGAIRAEITEENDPYLMACDSEIIERRDDTEGTDRPGWFVSVLTLTSGPLVC